jgi:uncharacterized membrane protein
MAFRPIAAAVAAGLFALWYLRYYRIVKKEAEQGVKGNPLTQTLKLMTSDIRLVWKPVIVGAVGGIVVLAQTVGFSLMGLVMMDPTVWSGVLTAALSVLVVTGVAGIQTQILLYGLVGGISLIAATSLFRLGIDE